MLSTDVGQGRAADLSSAIDLPEVTVGRRARCSSI